MLITGSIFHQARQCKISYISMITSSAKLKTFGVFLMFCLIYFLFFYIRSVLAKSHTPGIFANYLCSFFFLGKANPILSSWG